MKKRLLILSVLLLMVCGQMWALSGYRSGTANSTGTTNGISYTLYSDYSYYCWWSDQSQYLGNVAVITSCSNSTMVIPESLGDCNQIVIGESALTSNVTSLTISKSVKLLEFCAVYYADKIQTLIIEDSDSPLYCGGTKKTYSYGAFSYIKNLKSVYIGRNLEYEHTEDDHYTEGDYSYAPFRYCASGMHYNNESFDVTIGPNVTKIADYCFEYCGVKSLTVKRSLSQASQNNPIDWGKKAFENFDNKFVTSNVPCYVSWTALDNFKNKSDYKTMFNYQLGVEPCRYEALEKIKQKREDTNYSDIKSELEAACADYETTIKNTNDINLMQLLMTRIFAVMELLKQKYDYPSDVAASIVSEYKAKIDNANIDNIEGERDNGKQALVDAKALQDAKTAAKNDLTEAKITYPSDAAAGIVSTYTDRINAATTTDVVTSEKEAGIQALQNACAEQVALQNAKTEAIAALNTAAETNPSDAAAGIVSTYTDRINAATTTDGVTNEKDAGIQALAEAKELQDAKTTAFSALMAEAGQSPSEEVAQVRDTWKANVNKAGTISDVNTQRDNGIAAIRLQIAKETAIAALNATAETNPSDAAAGIVSTYTDRINTAATTDGVTNEKEAGIQALQNACAEQVALQNAKTEAIAALNTAAGTYPSDAADAIVSTYTDRINEAATPDAVNAARNEGVQALQDAHDAQKEAERLAALDAVTVQQLADDDFSYLLEGEGVELTFAGDNVNMTVNGVAATGFTLSETDAITVCPARTFTVIANEDPDNKGKCYSTFYTSEGAYKVPATAKAYTGEVEGDDVLKLKNVGSIIHAKEAVILRASESNLLLMPSCCTVAASPDNMLQGSDVPMTMPANSYALSYGQNKLGFYDFSGRELPANKAFLLLDAAAHSNGLRFVFDDATDIDTPVIDAPANAYNLQGQQVDETYQGIVIINGKKVLKR